MHTLSIETQLTRLFPVKAVSSESMNKKKRKYFGDYDAALKADREYDGDKSMRTAVDVKDDKGGATTGQSLAPSIFSTAAVITKVSNMTPVDDFHVMLKRGIPDVTNQAFEVCVCVYFSLFI